MKIDFKKYAKVGVSVAVVGVTITTLILLYKYIKKRRDIKKVNQFTKESDFVGISKNKAFTKPYVKAKNQTGYADLYKLSQFDFGKDGKIVDYTEKDIIQTRILLGTTFYQILPDKWVKEEDLVIPSTYKK